MASSANPQGLCVTGGERSVREVAARLAAHPQHLQEVRLDLLESLGDDAFALLRAQNVVATCRPKSEGGGFQGSEDERAQVLRRALAQRPGWLDVEQSASRTLRDELYAASRGGPTRLLLSFHCFQGAGAGLDRAESLAREPADALKVAVSIDDAAELTGVRALLAREERPVVRLGMGDAGLLSRALYRQFGSPWTYVVADGVAPTAPGQLTVSRAAAYRLLEEGLRPMGVLGGPQVLHSNGQRAYNTLFARRALPFHYLPVVTSRPATLDLLEALGFAGVSVTMPLKEQLVPLVHELEPEARTIGAVNTVRFDQGRRWGGNTDVVALRALLPRGDGAALILGAGGAARAAIVALHELGWRVFIANRTPERSQRLEALGARAVQWEARGQTPFQVLVNATPCGADGTSDPLPSGVSLEGKTVLDMVVGSAPTPLMTRTLSDGGRAIPGSEMWVHQGAAQMRALAGLEISVADLRELLRG